MSTRRGFLGMLLAGGGATALAAAGIPAGGGEKVTGSIIVPKDKATMLAEALKSASDGVVLADDNAVMGDIGLDKSEIGWFGVSTATLLTLTTKQYSEWLHAHLEVNRNFGVPTGRVPFSGHTFDRDRDMNMVTLSRFFNAKTRPDEGSFRFES